MRDYGGRPRNATVGELCNAAVALACHDLLSVWNDGLYLPHRLTYSVERFEPARGFFKPEAAWLWEHGALSGPIECVFHAGSC